MDPRILDLNINEFNKYTKCSPLIVLEIIRNFQYILILSEGVEQSYFIPTMHLKICVYTI